MLTRTNSTPNPMKYYLFTAIYFLVAICFHVSVYHRFGLMEEDLAEAARIKFTMNWDELNAFDSYLKSVRLHREGIQDTVDALEYAAEAEFLRESVVEEEEVVQILKEDAKEKEQQATVDMRKSDIHTISGIRDSRASGASTIIGMNLAKQAEDENERSEVMMNRTAEEEAMGIKMLHEAQQALQVAEAAQNHADLDKGICKWASVVCNMVRTNDGNETQGVPVAASDAVIEANKDIQFALLTIHNAELERSEAIELHRNASIQANLSREILWDIGVFKNQSEAEFEEAAEYRINAVEEENEAKTEEKISEQEEADIVLKQLQKEYDTNQSESLLKRVAVAQYREHYAIEKMNTNLEYVEKRRIELEQKIEEANYHIALAGWEALLASLSGLCLIVLVTTRIVATFRYQRPLRWILREKPYFFQDLWYLVCHLCIFLLAMGYVGELLMVFNDQTNIARAGITIIFALCVAFLQVTLLHIIPSMRGMIQESRIDGRTIRSVAEMVVVQKGAMIALISALEMLIVWCWMGTVAFTQVHKLNTYMAWLIVLCISIGYGYYVQTEEYAFGYLPTRSGTDFGAPLGAASSSDCQLSKNEERISLLMPACSTVSQGSIPGYSKDSFAVNPSNSSPVVQSSAVSAGFSSLTSMQSVPIGDSNKTYDDDYKTFSNILSTSLPNFSWISEPEKIWLLLEFCIVSFALWIVRRDLAMIRKLSPLAAGLIWGQVPLWILNTCLIVLFAKLIVSFASKKNGKERGLATIIPSKLFANKI